MSSKAIPDISPREANIRRAAHLYHCFGDRDRATAICASEGIAAEERELGWQLAMKRENGARQLVAAIKENPWPE